MLLPAPYELTIAAAGFTERIFSGLLHPRRNARNSTDQNIAAARTTVQVGLSRAEVAEEQMTAEEKQRVLGIIPDFCVNYVPNAAPLDFKQTFNRAWKATSDPFAFVLAGAIAGLQQSQNYFKGYGQGFKGYAKCYGANYAIPAN